MKVDKRVMARLIDRAQIEDRWFDWYRDEEQVAADPQVRLSRLNELRSLAGLAPLQADPTPCVSGEPATWRV